jgi:uncharacterized protein (DUF427 family)
MSKSPGHQKHPDHHVIEHHLKERVTLRVKDEIIAESSDVIRVDEDGHPTRYYFPRGDVRMERLQPTSTTSECPFKGVASYFTLNADGRQLKDAAWSYETPYDEHLELKERVAFWEERTPELAMNVAA